MVHYEHISTSLSSPSNMDTPEGYISGIQSGRIQPLPTYTPIDTSSHPPVSAIEPLDTRHIPPLYTKEVASSSSRPTPNSDDEEEAGPILQTTAPSQDSDYRHLYRLSSHRDDLTEEERQLLERESIVRQYFTAIAEGKGDVIDIYLTRNLVTANTKDADGKTPLLAAVDTKNVKIVQQLLDAGAEPDAYGIVAKERTPYAKYNASNYWTLTHRTPLQQASSIGHLPLVKLFLERYNCNDALIAPDGQIALRLAASNNHREIVDYLPTRRGGGFLRWQTSHRRSLARVKNALEHIGKFIKFFVWDIEKFFLWTCPKHIIVKPVSKACVYCWVNKKRFYDACIAEAAKTPGRVKRAGKWVLNGLKKIPHGMYACARQSVQMIGEAGLAMKRGIQRLPSFIVRTGKELGGILKDIAIGIWRLLTVELPRVIKGMARWTWEMLTIHIPRAISTTARWIYSGIVSILTSILEILTRLTSLIHTAVVATITFFRNLSLTDIINAVRDVLHAVFVSFPLKMWEWVKAFGDVSYKVMKGLFGCVGEVIWWIVTALGWVVTFLPRKIWEILVGIGGSVARGAHEILVFFKPKA